MCNVLEMRCLRLRRVLASWRADGSGATAIEFAIVAMPFLMLLYGIIGVALYFFTTFALENALEQAARLLRTGQAQQAGMTDAQFKAKVCELVPGYVDCETKILVNVRSYAQPDLTPTITQGECLNNGALANATTYSPGTASQVVLVSLCYEWEFAKIVPFINLGNMNGGSRLIQAATVFRTEPYEN
jgi:Flp pilus assembly protein TadG